MTGPILMTGRIGSSCRDKLAHKPYHACFLSRCIASIRFSVYLRRVRDLLYLSICLYVASAVLSTGRFLQQICV